MSTATTTLSNGSQLNTEYDFSKIFLGNNDDRLMTLTEASSSETTFTAGTILGRITDGGADDGKVVPLASGATDGSQFPVGILMNTITLASDAEAEVSVVYKGVVDSGKLVFDGSDTLATVISDRTLGDRLTDLGINYKTVTELSESDNS